MKLHLAVFAVVFLFALAPSVFAVTTIHAPAVDTNGRGVLTVLEANVVDGTGAVFIDIEPYISVDTQQSARTAAEIAAEEAQVDLKKYDVLFKILAKTQIVDGPSGGAGLALVAYGEFTKRNPRKDLAITGSIERDGSVGTVGGVYEKALSLKGTGTKLFLIPKGQVKYQGKNLALEAEKFGVQVVEVRNIKDVIKYAFTSEGSKVEAQVFEEQPLVIEKISNPAQLEPLKQIALEEIAALEKLSGELEKEKDTEILRESVNKSIFESKYLLEQGYYYSAANLVFVAKISTESVKLKNVSQTEFMRMVQELENDAKTISFGPLTVENMEWSVGAKLRYYWASNKIKGIKKTIGITGPDELHGEYVAAKNWVAAAKRMNEIAKGIGGKAIANQNGVRQAAEELIQSLNQTQSFVLDSEIEQHYSGAVAAYGKADYATALFDALFAKAITEAEDKIESQIGSDFTKGLRSSRDLDSYEGSIWAQYYFIHSLYSVAQANRTNEFIFTVNAIKLQHLSNLLEENIPMMKEALLQEAPAAISFPGNSEGGGFKVQTKVTPQQPEVNTLLLIVLALLGVVLLALLIRGLNARRRMAGEPLSIAEKIEKLDELLMRGEISERNWEILHQRYFRQMRTEKSGKTKTKAKTARKTKS